MAHHTGRAKKACENVKVEDNVGLPVHVEWPIMGKPNENEKEGTKSTVRYAKDPSLLQTQTSYLKRKKWGMHVPNKSGCV